MTAAATKAIIIVSTRLTVALIIETCDTATILAFINWKIIWIMGVVKASFLKRIYMIWIVNVMILIHAVVDLRSKCARTKVTIDNSVAGLTSSVATHSCAATLARAVIISFTRHAFTFIWVTICWARWFCCFGFNWSWLCGCCFNGRFRVSDVRLWFLGI